MSVSGLVWLAAPWGDGGVGPTHHRHPRGGEQEHTMASQVRDGLSRLPSVDAVLERHDASDVMAVYGREPFARALRTELDTARDRIRQGGPVPRADEIVAAADARLEAHRGRRLTRVVNATGVVLHTNLGRAPLSADARAAVADAAGYTSLEYDLAKGARGSRTAHVGDLAAELCGTEAATVVNNGAAALMLVTAALAGSREVVVSRGELIEIGGSYRLPDVMAASGALLREVGTTNRTRLADYRSALGDETGLLLKVHRSNYRVVGFTEDTPAGALAQLGREQGVPFAYDLGSGLVHAGDGPLASEPSIDAAVRAGADLIVFSGDKLLGGPQAGVIAGRADLLLRCTQHPLARAFRIDKLQRAAMEATLEAHLRTPVPLDVPTVAMLHADPERLRQRAQWMADQLAPGAEVAPVRAVVGGGSVPGAELESFAVVLSPGNPDRLAARLREGRTPVIARVEDNQVLLDLRTVPPAQDPELADLLLEALGR
jgi:L-seryl-tRNA(Ser) seleniumtransferase